jgi:hypothetical protein
MTSQWELDWLGGPAERRLRRRRPGIDDLPWGTLAADLPPDPAAEQLVWTDGAFREYASAAAFSALTTALLEAGAPIDLVAMAGDFVVDEMVHVELNARVAAELGGAAPYHVDLEKVSPYVDPALPAIERAAELALTTSCVGEALSVPSLAGSLRSAHHPLIRAVLARIVRDEGPHARLGWIVLDWAGDRIDRARLAAVARDRLAAYAPLWACDDCPETRILARAAAEDVVRPLAARGICVDDLRG